MGKNQYCRNLQARYNNGINGPLKGKVGNTIAANWRGIDYLRSTWEVTKPASPAQLNQRHRFALAIGWVKPLISLINIGYQSVKTAKTPLNAAVSYHIKHAVVGKAPDFQIDFPKAIFSIGTLQPAVIREISREPEALMYVRWEDQLETIFCAGTDRATFIIYNPEKKTFLSFKDAAMRADGEVMLELPPSFEGDALHLYLFYVRSTGEEVSTAQYLGVVRPDS